MLTSKLHRARVTDVNMDYEGSIEIDQDLMDRVDMATYEQVHVFNINNGSRFITYVIPGKRGSKAIMINGAAARLAQINDRIIIVAYGMIDNKELKDYHPKKVLLDVKNDVVEGP